MNNQEEIDKEKIIHARLQGDSYSSIARQFGISRSFVVKTTKHIEPPRITIQNH